MPSIPSKVITVPYEPMPASSKPVLRLTVIEDAKTITNEAELVGRAVVMCHPACKGEKGKIAKVVTAKRLKESWFYLGCRDVFYTIETPARFITGVMWQDFLQLPRQ